MQSYNKGTHKDDFLVERLIKYQREKEKLYHFSIFLEFYRHGVRGDFSYNTCFWLADICLNTFLNVNLKSFGNMKNRFVDDNSSSV